MNNNKINKSFDQLNKALLALEKIASKPMDEDQGFMDATIQRFEFTIELFWKLLKVILETRGVAVEYPRDTLQAVYKGKLIHDENVWLSMLKDRNLTSHTYNQPLAHEIYNRIQQYIPIFKKTLDSLRSIDSISE